VDAAPPTQLTLELDSERIELTMVQPPSQLAAIADAIRAQVRGAGQHDTAELQETARTKLGRVVSFSMEPHVIALVGALDADERVLDLAFGAGEPTGLLAVTTRRLIFVPSRGLGIGEPEAVVLKDVGVAELTDDGSVVAGGRRWTRVAPDERAASLVEIVRARAGSERDSS
jgi:hypothetical protein